MIKKQLGVLAAAVLLVSGANAAVSGGSLTQSIGGSGFQEWQGVDSDVVIWLADSTGASGSAFINWSAINAAVSVDGLVDGSLNQSIDLASLGIAVGLYDTFGITAMSRDMSTTYGYEQHAVTAGSLFLSANGQPAPAGGEGGVEGNVQGSAWTLLDNWFGEINGEMGVANQVAVNTSSIADLDNNGARLSTTYTNGVSIGSAADLWFFGILDETPEPLHTGSPDVLIDYTQLTGTAALTGSTFSVSAVPVPAAAWLFGSALLGLGVVRRRS